jgi:aminopeptidase N
MLDRSVPAAIVVDSLLAAAPAEADEQTRQRLLGYVGTAWWKFLQPSERDARAARAERTLRAGLDAATTASQKSGWFGALRHLALTAPTLTWLTDVWEQTASIPGLPLAEDDYAALALDLAVREVPGWSAILDRQLARIENPDRKGRFQFIMPALSADADMRGRWFHSLQDVANRRREPWVLDGLRYLHHPLRAGQSARHVREGLDMLWDIQRTGDIFFPKRWMDATLAGHASEAVASDVRQFLATLPPGYPARLRNIVLQSADDLFRAVGPPP